MIPSIAFREEKPAMQGVKPDRHSRACKEAAPEAPPEPVPEGPEMSEQAGELADRQCVSFLEISFLTVSCCQKQFVYGLLLSFSVLNL